MRSLLIFVWVIYSSTLLVGRQPNVVIIFTDDQGASDVNVYGATDLSTPHMDALAKRGVRFTQFYAAASVCSPSRVGLLTGRTPQHGGLAGNVVPGSGGMPPEQVTIAETLKEAGYATAHIGKWHLGHTENTVPNAQGFDHSFGHLVGCIDNYSHFFYWSGPNRHDLWRNGKAVYHDGEYFPDLMVKEAKEFIHKHVEQPFFIYFAFNAPHYPYQGTPKCLQHYTHLEYPRNLYAAFLSTIDERIGELVDIIDAQGLSDDTIIIFQSDHGHSNEVRAHGGGGQAAPYRGAKFSLYEGGLRVPAMITWPNEIPENTVRAQLATGCDWYPTILELCGIPHPGHLIDGKSLVPVIKDPHAPTAHQSFNWKNAQAWSVREAQWKLIVSQQGPELYDIPKDPGESNNLANQYPEVVTHLTTVSETYWRRIDSKPKN